MTKQATTTMFVSWLLCFGLLWKLVLAQSADCTEGDLRLPLTENDATTITGYPQYCYNGQWRNICSSETLWSGGSVACRQLGYGARRFTRGVNNSPTSEFVEIKGCNGNDTAIQQCEVSDSVSCLNNHQVRLACHKVVCPSARVQLVGGVREGWVEVCVDGRWGTVQTSQLTLVAQDVCSRLGHGEPVQGTTVNDYPQRSSRTVFNCSIDCGSLTCLQSPSNNHTDDMAVTCSDDTNYCTSNQLVRLMDQYSFREGRVEACFNGHWTQVCDLARQPSLPGEICHQLGFPRKDAMITSYGEVIGDHVCCHITPMNILLCERCHNPCNKTGVICQLADSSKSKGECALQTSIFRPNKACTVIITPTSKSSVTVTARHKPMTELPTPTVLVNTTDTTTVTQNSSQTLPDLTTPLLGVTGVLFVLTLLSWTLTCVCCYKNMTQHKTERQHVSEGVDNSTDNYSLGQLIDRVYDETTPIEQNNTTSCHGYEIISYTQKAQNEMQVTSHTPQAVVMTTGDDRERQANHHVLESLETPNGNYYLAQIIDPVYDNTPPTQHNHTPRPGDYATISIVNESATHDTITGVQTTSHQPQLLTTVTREEVTKKKADDDFYNAEKHTYTAINIKYKNKASHKQGQEERKREQEDGVDQQDWQDVESTNQDTGDPDTDVVFEPLETSPTHKISQTPVMEDEGQPITTTQHTYAMLNIDSVNRNTMIDKREGGVVDDGCGLGNIVGGTRGSMWEVEEETAEYSRLKH